MPPPVEAWADDAPARRPRRARRCPAGARASRLRRRGGRRGRRPLADRGGCRPRGRWRRAPPTARHIRRCSRASSSMAAFGKADRANKAAAAALSKAAEAEDAEPPLACERPRRRGDDAPLRPERPPGAGGAALAATDRTIEDAAMRRPATAPQRAGGAYGRRGLHREAARSAGRVAAVRVGRERISKSKHQTRAAGLAPHRRRRRRRERDSSTAVASCSFTSAE